MSLNPHGYRSLHQVFSINSRTHPKLNSLRVELQIRTKLQHSWATAVRLLELLKSLHSKQVKEV